MASVLTLAKLREIVASLRKCRAPAPSWSMSDDLSGTGWKRLHRPPKQCGPWWRPRDEMTPRQRYYYERSCERFDRRPDIFPRVFDWDGTYGTVENVRFIQTSHIAAEDFRYAPDDIQ